MLRLGLAVVDFHSKTARQCEYDLLQLPVGMTAAFGIDGDIVEIVDARDIEGDMITTLYKSQITAWVLDLWQVNDLNAALGCVFFIQRLILAQ